MAADSEIVRLNVPIGCAASDICADSRTRLKKFANDCTLSLAFADSAISAPSVYSALVASEPVADSDTDFS